MNIGDTIKCIDAQGSEFLNRYYLYKVIDINIHGNIRVQEIRSEEKSTHYYKPSRFKVVVALPSEETQDTTVNNELMLVNMTSKYRTRDGDNVKIYLVDGNCSEYPVIGAIDHGNHWQNAQWTRNGGYFNFGEESDYDLEKVPTEARFLTNMGRNVTIYMDGSVLVGDHPYQCPLSKSDVKTLISQFKSLNGAHSLD